MPTAATCLFHELALGVCAREGIDLRFNHLDTTSFSLSGEYIPDRDEQAMTITHGYSSDHRPDLKQAVLELVVSQDGGIPFVSTSWDGNTSDIEIFQARTQALLAAFQSAPSPRYLIADSKLYHEDNAAHLRHLGFITRIPNTIGAVSEAITQALAMESWARLDENTRYQRLELCHYGMAQRWLVVHSQAALERAEATLNQASAREEAAIHKQLLHLQAQRFATPAAAQEALTALAKGWTYHQVDSYHLSDHKRYARKGRPTPSMPVKAIAWQIQAHVRPHEAVIEHQKQQNACCCARDQYRRQRVERYRGPRGLQTPVPGGRGLPVSQRSAVFCLVVVCQKALPYPRALDGDDARLAGLLGGTTPTAPALGPLSRDGAEPNPPTHHVANLTLGLPAVGRHSPRAGDRPRSGA